MEADKQQQQQQRQQVVLVTGASGCLGQHVVRMLHERDDSVGEIRCYDIKPFQNNLQTKITKEMQIFTGDIRNHRLLAQAMSGVDVVIHCAALVDVSLMADAAELESVNVTGTQHVVDCAVECGVPYLVHVSGVDVVIGHNPIYYSAENTSMVPEQHLLVPYSRTKWESEEVVREAQGRPLIGTTNHHQHRANLTTIILRPSLMYGEEDQHFVTRMLRISAWNGGTLRRIDNIFTRLHPVYVGNVAHACLRAKDAIQRDPKLGGEEFIITDDTKILDPFEFFQPYLEARNLKLSVRAYPFWLFIWLFSLYCWLVLRLKPLAIRTGWMPPAGLTPATIRLICNTYFFNRTKATLRLDYDPVYDHQEAQRRSLDYYRKVSL